MADIDYDVTKVKDDKPRLRALPVAAKRKKEPEPEPGSFEDRFRFTNLVHLIDFGIEPTDYLPASDGMLIRGKRHSIAAPAKSGKSIGVLVHLVDMALAGADVAVLDVENGSQTYAQRLDDILRARDLSEEEKQRVGRAILYSEYPKAKLTDGAALAARLSDYDLVIFDSQRMFLSAMDLAEDGADDYARFMQKLIEPLSQHEVATLILDNTGHGNTDRARGSSAKGDLNEIMFSLKQPTEFDIFRCGSLKLKVETTRFGNKGEWTLQIGGGTYGSWEPEGSHHPAGPDFLTAVFAALEKTQPLGQDKLIAAARGEAGVKLSTDAARAALVGFVETGVLRRTKAGFEKVTK